MSVYNLFPILSLHSPQTLPDANPGNRQDLTPFPPVTIFKVGHRKDVYRCAV